MIPNIDLFLLVVFFFNKFQTFPQIVSFSAVVILCFICTITTNFEYQLKCSKVGFNFLNGEHCMFKSTSDELCDVDTLNIPASCQIVHFDASTGKPCPYNQSNASASCQEVNTEFQYSLFVFSFIWIFWLKSFI